MKEKERDFDVVFVRFGKTAGRSYMFEAPRSSGIDEGDAVIVPDSEGKETEAIVTGTDRIDMKYEVDKGTYKRYLAITGATDPLKRIIAKIIRRDMEYEEDTENDE